MVTDNKNFRSLRIPKANRCKMGAEALLPAL